ncbi:MAG: hypothetical protein ACR2PZ_11425 [Pseudomonadales bacterium]
MAEPAPLERITAAIAQQQVSLADDPALTAIVAALQQRYGDSLEAIVLYGSYLLGKRDSLLDCYALLNDRARNIQGNWQWLLQRLLPPNVYYLSSTELGTDAHAKCATLTVAQLNQAIDKDSHSYFWSRFAQPCAVLYCADERATQTVLRLRTAAIARCISEAAALAPNAQDFREFWIPLFKATYSAELRAESPQRAALLVDANHAYYDRLYSLGKAAANRKTRSERAQQSLWRRRRWGGKALSLLRLMKASLTFNDGLEYLLWKMERHSGVHLEASERQRRYPLLFAWPLIWRAYRLGGFR